MNAKEFNNLTTDERGNVTFKDGLHIDERVKYNEHIVQLYSVHRFYVEIYYDVRNNEIAKVIALEDDKDYEGYLSSIRLNDLY